MSRGLRGEFPPHYLLYRAAKYMGVPAWELAERPVFWMNWAIEFEQAEIWAEQEDMKRHRHRSGGSSTLQ